MPWTFIARVVFGLVAYRFLRTRRRGEPMVDVDQLRGRIGAAREPASIAAHLITTVVLTAFTSVVATAATTLLVSSPKWLGGVLMAIAVVFGIAALQELLKLRREVAARRRRRHNRELTRELEERRFQ